MALLLAPYNEAMRLGMGFNSYTQRLCVNDVVRKPGGIRATESDLKPQQPQLTGSGAGANDSLVKSGDDSGMLGNSSSGAATVQSTSKDGQSTVSQVVSWEAGFIDRVSEVTNKLNISGALTITVDALAGAELEGHYLDSNALKASEVNYNILVKVSNQRLVAPDITEFTPIPNVPESKFTEIYGDCFISGFIEGGIFHAMVSKNLIDESAVKEMGGKLGLKLKVAGVGEGKVSASGEKVDTNNMADHKTKITLNWSGGGDIKPDHVKEWDISRLMEVAMEFPDKVAALLTHPQVHRRHSAFQPPATNRKIDHGSSAVLTKYSSLRTFHEQTVRGSPLDYENAGIYTSSLLDTYMEYKLLWSTLAQTISDHDHGKIRVTTALTSAGLEKYGLLFKQDYHQRKAEYDEVTEMAKKNPVAYKNVVLEAPLPPNEVKPYDGDFFGLAKAQRDCRFEMIKLVNAVTFDPKIATDPNRNWRILPPSIFRRLLPGPKLLPAIKDAEEVQKVKEHAEEVQKVKEQLEADLKQARDEAAKLRNEMSMDKERVQELEAKRDNVPEVVLHSVIYGDRQYLKSGPGDNVLKHITKRWVMTANNEFFQGDPNPGVRKTCVISWTRKFSADRSETYTLLVHEGLGANFADPERPFEQ
ncbi:hypothetical protein EJ04DRAFT_519903 [Polyplosphaeria fusca]|uniref:MACPF domain-containing protein n=1 Tax=Polyplosphaeria fusca TaxID=682080 RepID=A0A9P4V5N8_9PLEO|nr:hypothetical protein EJ04DRAFT_519903 [Polyplosphaeria fusca]